MEVYRSRWKSRHSYYAITRMTTIDPLSALLFLIVVGVLWNLKYIEHEPL